MDEVVHEILHSYIKYNKTKACLRNDLQALKNILPKPNKLPSTVYKLLQYVSNLVPLCEILIHYCCQTCNYYCGTQQPIICAACNSNNGSVPFYKLNIIDQIRYLFQYKNLADILNKANSRRNNDKNIINDVTDGSEYKRVNSNRRQYDITLIMSTDGACVKKNSSNHLWPVSFIIAEVPPTIRRHFMLYILIWYTNMKPEMNSYLLPMCVRLKSSFQNGGFTWVHPRTRTTFKTKITAPLFVADAPARAMIQYIHNFNGMYGCNICEIKTQKVKREEGKRHIRVYKYRCDESCLRTNIRMKILGKMAQKSQNH